MGEDGINGQVAAHALVLNEQIETLHSVLDTLRNKNSCEIVKIKTGN